MRRSSKILKFGSSKVWVTAQKPSSVFFVPLCETISGKEKLEEHLEKWLEKCKCFCEEGKL